jgi:chemotaxis protein CheC
MPLITEVQLDALQEFINIGVGRAAALLNEMVEAPIQLSVPVLRVFDNDALRTNFLPLLDNQQFAAVRLAFAGTFSGSAELLFPTESAVALVSLLTGEDRDSPDLDGVKVGTLTELGNIVINGILGSLSNLLKQRMDYTLPLYHEGTLKKLLSLNHLFGQNTVFLLAQAKFEITQLEIVGELILVFEMTSFSELLNGVDQELHLLTQSSRTGGI